MKKIVIHKKNRVCSVSGCKNLLSIYNPQVYCYVHQRVRDTEIRSVVSRPLKAVCK
jgi:hypothetical protein